MQTAAATPPHTDANNGKNRADPPPLWFVSNGEVTVGPVTTNLLVRGVFHERVPRECLVRERTWKHWRKLDRIREIAALRRDQSRDQSFVVEPTRWKEPKPGPQLLQRLERDLLRAGDPGELLVHCLTETMRTTGAWVGAVHRRRPGHAGFVTTGVSGPAMASRLGHLVPAEDPALLVAAQGKMIGEIPRPGAPSGRIQGRLGAFPACGGVAMAPVLCCGRLYAMIELGRPDHAFRETDLRLLRGIAEVAVNYLTVVRNGPASRALWVDPLLSATH